MVRSGFKVLILSSLHLIIINIPDWKSWEFAPRSYNFQHVLPPSSWVTRACQSSQLKCHTLVWTLDNITFSWSSQCLDSNPQPWQWEILRFHIWPLWRVKVMDCNYEKGIQNMQNIANSWKFKYLTIFGKITVIKTIMLPQLTLLVWRWTECCSGLEW